MYTPKISLTPNTRDEILTEIAVLEGLVDKFRGEQSTLDELKVDIQVMIEEYHKISVLQEIEDVEEL